MRKWLCDCRFDGHFGHTSGNLHASAREGGRWVAGVGRPGAASRRKRLVYRGAADKTHAYPPNLQESFGYKVKTEFTCRIKH